MRYLIYVTLAVLLLGAVTPASALSWTNAGGCWTASLSGNTYVMWNVSQNTTYHVQPGVTSATLWMVGGGGSGGGYYYSGGGGAGNYTTATISLTPGSDILVTVGSGGASQSGNANGNNGTLSQFNTIVSLPGVGGFKGLGTGVNGDFQGGAAQSGTTGPEGGHGAADSGHGGGGGGSTFAGSAGTATPSGGAGGNYVTVTIGDETRYFAQGGSGGAFGAGSTSAPGLIGGTGANETSAATAGLNQTGSGGGGGAHTASFPTGGAGGSGIIIIRYVTPAPTESFIGNPTQGVTPYTVTFNASSTYDPAVGFNWTFGDGTGSQAGPTVTHTYYGNSTSYDVTLRASYLGFNDSVTSSAGYIVALPKIADFSTSTSSYYTNTSIIFTSTGNFTSQPDTTNLFAWGDGNTTLLPAGTTSTSYQWHSPGTYQVAVNTTNQYGTNTTIKSISVVNPPTNYPYWSATATYVNYYPATIWFNITNTLPSPVAMNWSWGDGTWTNRSVINQIEFNATHTYSGVGLYDVAVSIIDVTGIVYTNTTPNAVNIQYPTYSVGNSPSYANINLTGMFTIAATNVSMSDGMSFGINYNFTQINITSVTLNSSAADCCLLNPGYSTPGIIQVNLSFINKSTVNTMSVVDVKYLVKDITNNTGVGGAPWMPVNFDTSTGTSYIFANKTLYSNMSAYTPKTTVPGSLFFTNTTFVKKITFENYNTHNIISSQALISYWTGATSGSTTTYDGTISISSTYGTVSLNASASGYPIAAWDILFSNNNPETLFMVPTNGVTGVTTWYVPKQIKFVFYDSQNNVIPGLWIRATPQNFTAPVEWTQILIGIQPSVNISGTTLNGFTATDGSWFAPMVQSFKYDFRMMNGTSNIDYRVSLYPQDTEYRIWIPTASSVNNTYSQINGTALLFSEPNSSYMNMGMTYVDSSGLTQNVTFVVTCTNNGTIMYQQTFASFAPATVLQSSYTVQNVRGDGFEWKWVAYRQGDFIGQSQGVTAKGPTGLLVDLGLPSAKYYQWISFILLFLMAMLASQRTAKYWAILIPIMAAIFMWFGWFTGTSSTWGIVVLCGVVGAIFYMRSSLRDKFGISGPGAMLMNITFYLIILQAVVGFVNHLKLWGANVAATPANQWTNVDLSKVHTIVNSGGWFDGILSILTVQIEMLLGALHMFLDIMLSTVFIYGTLTDMYPWMKNIEAVNLFLQLLQVGIWFLYAVMVFKLFYRSGTETDL